MDLFEIARIHIEDRGRNMLRDDGGNAVPEKTRCHAETGVPLIGFDLADHAKIVFEPLVDKRNGILETVNADPDILDFHNGFLLFLNERCGSARRGVFVWTSISGGMSAARHSRRAQGHPCL
jgi:hypothetical protein